MVAHFEIPTRDPDKVSAFYQNVFGWEVRKWEGPEDYWLVTAGESSQPETGVALHQPDPSPLAGTVSTVDVSDLDEALDLVREHKGRIFIDKMTIPGVGYLAYCKDVEGNIFGVMQGDPTAI